MQKNTQSPAAFRSLLSVGEDSDTVATAWFLRQRGPSHWKSLLSRFESIVTLESPPFVQAVREHIKGSCLVDFALPGNFPFGSTQAARYADPEAIYTLIQKHRLEVQLFVDNYFALYQPIYPLLDPEDFQTSLKLYWDDPAGTGMSWLGQLLIVLGLGLFATKRDIRTAASFFFAGEACLAKTPYMFRPSTTDLQTLCLAVIAKQIANATCWSLDACWNVMGILVRLAVMLGIHQGPPLCSIDARTSDKELEDGRRLWTIIVYMDVQLSLVTGQPSLLPTNALLVTKDVIVPFFSNPDAAWGIILPESLPTICHFLRRINSTSDSIAPDEVQQYDIEIRQIMGRIATLPGKTMSRMAIDVFFRRALLSLHRRYAFDEEHPSAFPASYWGSLECSLALLVHLRDLADDCDQLDQVELVRQPFMLDFFSAAVTASVHLLRTDTPLDTTFTDEGTIPPRQTILETLQSCIEIFEKEKEKSLCFRAGYYFLSSVFNTIPGAVCTNTNQRSGLSELWLHSFKPS